MAQTFKLKNGEILINNSGLIISDDARKQRLRWFLASILWISYATTCVIRFFQTGDQFLLWSGLVIGILQLVVFVLNMIKTDKKELLFSEIKSIKERKLFDRFIDIRLKNNRLRRITPEGNLKDILENLEAKVLAK